ncbi:hypothetical protein L6164_022461 [Bauhinia variegata]|uniref:Uncharacterized protein n=1 Tax=Bauhinia variegata TaxID=167791 RepID=A0ACB9MI59_BAUVA|nr:hypothetical protein L6164_022461 [Bauhinia variegata]
MCDASSSNTEIVPHRQLLRVTFHPQTIKGGLVKRGYHLCAWGNDAASKVLTEARPLLVENYFQTPSWVWVWLRPSRISGRAPL